MTVETKPSKKAAVSILKDSLCPQPQQIKLVKDCRPGEQKKNISKIGCRCSMKEHIKTQCLGKYDRTKEQTKTYNQ